MMSLQLSDQLELKLLNPFGVSIQGESIDIYRIPIKVLHQLILEHRLIVLRRCSTLNRDNLIKYCSGWGELLHWSFGVIFDLVVHEKPTNYLLSAGRVPFHWDGAFIDKEPSLEFFQCLSAPTPGTGGETLFCDTIKIWNNATHEKREEWKNIEIIYITESNAAHYGGKITIPLVSQHPKTGVTRLRYGEPLDQDTQDLTRLSMHIKGIPIDKHEKFLKDMQALIYNPNNCYVHQWKDGDIVIGDNHSLLHARNQFTVNTPRHLQRVHVL